MNKRNFASLKRGLEEANEAMTALRTYYDALLADAPPAHLLELLHTLSDNGESEAHESCQRPATDIALRHRDEARARLFLRDTRPAPNP